MAFTVRDSLASLAKVYGDRPAAAALHVRLDRHDAMPARGDTIRVRDHHGNEVDATVDGIEIRVLPDYGSLANPRLAGDQGRLL